MIENKDLENLTELKLWLEDNVDQGTDLFFDNEKRVDSAIALKSLDRALLKLKEL